MFVFLQSVRAAHKPQQLGWGGCAYKRSTAGWVLISLFGWLVRIVASSFMWERSTAGWFMWIVSMWGGWPASLASPPQPITLYFKIKSQRKKRYQCRDEPIRRCCTDVILNSHDLFSTKVTCATSIPWLYNFWLPCELWCLIANPQDNCNGVLIHRWPLLNLFDIFSSLLRCFHDFRCKYPFVLVRGIEWPKHSVQEESGCLFSLDSYNKRSESKFWY